MKDPIRVRNNLLKNRVVIKLKYLNVGAMYNIKKFLLFLLFILISPMLAFSSDLLTIFKKLPHSEFGVKANNETIDNLAKIVTDPKLSATGKSYLTVNRMGFDVLNTAESINSWVVTEFLEFIKGTKKPVLDIGAGYGHISLTALAQGNKVVANDIALEHLLNIRKFALNKHLSVGQLYLNINSFPSEMNFPNNSFDAIMLHRVIHFMSPQQIIEGFAKISKWLAPGGKVFIVVMSPQHKQFADWFLPIYEQKWQQGDKWPGVNLPVKKALPDQVYNLPKVLHVMDDRPLRLAFEKLGFDIEKSEFISMRHFATKPNERDGKEAMGIVAIKK